MTGKEGRKYTLNKDCMIQLNSLGRSGQSGRTVSVAGFSCRHRGLLGMHCTVVCTVYTVVFISVHSSVYSMHSEYNVYSASGLCVQCALHDAKYT